MHRAWLCLLMSTMIAGRLGAATSEPISWGKPGVTLDAYRKDAIECGRAGYYLDVSNTEAAKTFKQASSMLATNETDLASSRADTPNERMTLFNIVARSAQIVDSTNAPRRFQEVRTLMSETVAGCLKQRGYMRFRLTQAQQDRLRHLHLGSAERHTYLFGLASDPSILAAQAI